MNKYDALQKLQDLKNQGAITEEEFQREKAKLLNGAGPTPAGSAPAGPGAPPHPVKAFDDKTYIVIMHLSQLAGVLIPGLGFIVPIMMWLVKANESRAVDLHGRNIANFVISMLIYGFISFLLAFLIIGIPLLIILGILELVFILVATMKAVDGQYWKYPLAIGFIRWAPKE